VGTADIVAGSEKPAFCIAVSTDEEAVVWVAVGEELPQAVNTKLITNKAIIKDILFMVVFLSENKSYFYY
jgi:hypothetical protein